MKRLFTTLAALLPILLPAVPASAQAPLDYNLDGPYTLTDYRVDGSTLFISFAGMENLPLCGPVVGDDPRLALLARTRAGDRKIEVHATRGSRCIATIEAPLAPAERLAQVAAALKTLLPNSAIRLADFDKTQINDGPFPDMSASLRFLYVPQGQTGLSEISAYWRKKGPEHSTRYDVSAVHAYRNTEEADGYEEITQGHDNFEALPYSTTRIDPELLANIRAAARKHVPGLLKTSGRVDLVILEKPAFWLVKRIEHGDCSEDRKILTLRIRRSDGRPLMPVLSETRYGGECPD